MKGRGDGWTREVADFASLLEVGRLCASTGLTHAEINQMDAERVEGLIVMNEARVDWLKERED